MAAAMAAKRRKKNRAKSSMTTELAKVERALRSSSRESWETDQRTESSGARSAATMRGRPRAAGSPPPGGREAQQGGGAGPGGGGRGGGRRGDRGGPAARRGQPAAGRQEVPDEDEAGDAGHRQ